MLSLTTFCSDAKTPCDIILAISIHKKIYIIKDSLSQSAYPLPALLLLLVNDHKGSLEHLERVILQATVWVQPQAANNHKHSQYESTHCEGSYHDDQPEFGEKSRHRLNAGTIRRAEINVREHIVRTRSTPSGAIEKHLQP